MDCNEVVKDIIIPIASAIIGGVFTFLSVFITIKHEKKNNREEILLANKPLFCRMDPNQQYDYKSAIDFCMGTGNFDDDKKSQIYGVIKNTDNAILIVDSIYINGKKYESLYGEVVDKNQIFNLYINTFEELNLNDEIVFIVKDIFGNIYRYKIEVKYTDKSFAEIVGFKEIDN